MKKGFVARASGFGVVFLRREIRRADVALCADGRSAGATAPKFAMTNGETPHGSVMAFKVVGDRLGTKVRGGVEFGRCGFARSAGDCERRFFVLATGENAVQKGGEKNRFTNTHPAVLKALDAATGKELFNSKDAIHVGPLQRPCGGQWASLRGGP